MTVTLIFISYRVLFWQFYMDKLFDQIAKLAMHVYIYCICVFIKVKAAQPYTTKMSLAAKKQ